MASNNPDDTTSAEQPDHPTGFSENESRLLSGQMHFARFASRQTCRFRAWIEVFRAAFSLLIIRSLSSNITSLNILWVKRGKDIFIRASVCEKENLAGAVVQIENPDRLIDLIDIIV